MIHGIFRDKQTEEKFQRDGYVVLDFMSAKQAQTIASKFYETHQQTPEGFYADAFNPDDKLKADIFKRADDIMAPRLNEVFYDYKKLGCTFLSKSPGDKGKVGVHQDWTIVDERQYYSATIWIPVVDVNEQNGALKVLPGSHLFFQAYRSNNIPYGYRGHEEMIWENMITVPMKGGQAFILNHAVIHASGSNVTNAERLVIAYGVTHVNAALTFYHKQKEDPGNLVEQYAMPDDFFQQYYNVGQRPLFGKLVRSFDYDVTAPTAAQMKQMIARELQLRNLPVH